MPQCWSAVSQQQWWQSPGMQGMLLVGLLGAEAGPQLQWCPTVMVCGLCGVVPGQVSQTQEHQEALPQCDSGDLLPSLTDALPAAQLLCKQSWDWGLFLFIPSHKIFKFEKKPTPTPGKPPTTKDISREGYSPFSPAGQDCCPFVPWCSAFHFVVCCSWVRPGRRSLSKLGAS